ncbi:class I SAM-dependent methyltransferase [Dehalobacter sp. TBBPA1]|uniref:class I SAM-dependent methyltransferase n=1 Tax=Dehalobacter sp. TBBPA1 TaxID=3235037 RepID=UPI0034A1010A
MVECANYDKGENKLMIAQRNDFTYRLLMDAGIKKGLRVLDVGCGSGEVTFLAAEIVGSTGEVIGFDSNETAIAAARDSAVKNQFANTKFIIAEIDKLPQDLGRFDAIVGRRVLMYQPDAVFSIKSLLPYLKTKGLVVFQESDSMGSFKDVDLMPLHTQVQTWIWNTVAKEGGNIHMGMNLYSVFKQAGLTISQIRAEAVLQTLETGSDLAWVVQKMLPRIIKLGVINQKEIEIDTLEERLNSERQNANTVFVRDMAFGIWATIH